MESAAEIPQGTLFLVGTPIGNLSDFPPRAREVLSGVSVIACEDTRSSGKLLRHFGIDTPMTAYHQHNEHKKTGELINRLRLGDSVALISDAGMPAISDPGFLLARAAHQHSIPVVAIPGPVAAVTALAASGLPSDRFIFEGFLPPKKGRKTRLEAIGEEERTTLIYESPHRIERLVGELLEICGQDRLCAVCRELTKMYEEICRGTLEQVRLELESKSRQRGEFVLVLAGKNYRENSDT